MVDTIQVTSAITSGNLLTIVSIVMGVIINVIVLVVKLTKFQAVTEMKFQAGEKKFVQYDKDIENLDERCNTCSLKYQIIDLTKERDRMNTEQVSLRASLPVQLNNIENKIADVKLEITELRKDLALTRRNKSV